MREKAAFVGHDGARFLDYFHELRSRLSRDEYGTLRHLAYLLCGQIRFPAHDMTQAARLPFHCDLSVNLLRPIIDSREQRHEISLYVGSGPKDFDAPENAGDDPLPTNVEFSGIRSRF